MTEVVDFWKSQFVLLILVGLMLIFLSATIYGYKHNVPDLAAFCQGKAGEVLAAILTLVVSNRFRKADQNGKNGQEAPATTAVVPVVGLPSTGTVSP